MIFAAQDQSTFGNSRNTSLSVSHLRSPERMSATGATRSIRNLGTRVLYNNSPVVALSERNMSLLNSMTGSTISDVSMSLLSPRAERAFRRRPELFSVHKYAAALATSLCDGSPRDRLTPREVLSRIADNTSRSHSNIERVQAYKDIPKNKEITRMTCSKDPDVANSARRLDAVSRELAAAVAQIAHHVTRDESLAFGFDCTLDLYESST